MGTMQPSQTARSERQASCDHPATRVSPTRVSATRVSQEPIVVGLVNNMPDAALRATERQYCALLSQASRGVVVRLKLFSPPDPSRSPATASHIARYYEDYSDLLANPPDGLIVTGTEPRAARLQHEPFWPALSQLADWVLGSGVPSIWSCLAAHAAVLRSDGIDRVALPAKLSGVYECRIDSAAHGFVRGAPDRWTVPHSRLNGLEERALAAAGYVILSRSDETGPDIFIREGRALSVFFQGHPEYGPSALPGEYRRDVARYLRGERALYPDVPRGCFNVQTASRLAELRAQAERRRTSARIAEVTALTAGASQHSAWSLTAVGLYTNWLMFLDERRSCARLERQDALTPWPAPLLKSTQDAVPCSPFNAPLQHAQPPSSAYL